MYQSLIIQIKTMLENPYKIHNKLFLKQFGEQGLSYAHLNPDILFKLSMACVFAQHLKDFSFMEDAENDITSQSKVQYMKKSVIVKNERIEKLEKIVSLMSTTDPNMVRFHRELEIIALDYFDELSSAIAPYSYELIEELFKEIVSGNFDCYTYDKMQQNFCALILDSLPHLINVYPDIYNKASNQAFTNYINHVYTDACAWPEYAWRLEYGNILEKNEYSKSVKDGLEKKYWLELYTYQLQSLIQSMLSSFKYVFEESCYTHELNKLVQQINQIRL